MEMLLDIDFVEQALCSILGGLDGSFTAYLIEHRVFLFTVSCKAVGFEVYIIRNFVCADFKLSFHLFNDLGASVILFSIDL